MKLVMVDDSEADRRLFRILIEESFGSKLEFWGEGTGAKGLERCRAVAPDCILIEAKCYQQARNLMISRTVERTENTRLFNVSL